MATRNILNSDGVVIGELTLPDSASESQWEKALSAYTQPAAIQDVTPRQIRQAMVLSGISMSSIDSAINSLPEPTQSIVRIEWEYSVAFIRSNPLVAQIGAMLGFTSQQLDDLWRFAKTL